MNSGLFPFILGFAWRDACLLCVYLSLSTHSARRPGHLNSPIQFPSLQNACLKMRHCQCKLTWGGCHRDMCLTRLCCLTSAAADLLESRLQPSPALVGEEGGTSLGIQRPTSNGLITAVPLDQTEDKNRQENKPAGPKLCSSFWRR